MIDWEKIYDSFDRYEQELIDILCFNITPLSKSELIALCSGIYPSNAGIYKKKLPQLLKNEDVVFFIVTQNLDVIAPNKNIIFGVIKKFLDKPDTKKNISFPKLFERFKKGSIKYNLYYDFYNNFYNTETATFDIKFLIQSLCLDLNKDVEHFCKKLQTIESYLERIDTISIIEYIDKLFLCIVELDKRNKLPANFFDYMYKFFLKISLYMCEVDTILYNKIIEYKKEEEYNDYMLIYNFLKGNFSKLEQSPPKSIYGLNYSLYIKFLKGENIKDDIEYALKEESIKNKTKQQAVLNDFASIIQVPMMMYSGELTQSKLTSFLKGKRQNIECEHILIFNSFFKNCNVNNGQYQFISDILKLKNNDSLWSQMSLFICSYWLNMTFSKVELKDIIDIYEFASNQDYKYLALEIVHILAQITKAPKYENRVKHLKEELGVVRLLSDIYRIPQEYEKKLNMLLEFAKKNKTQNTSNNVERLVWLLDISSYGYTIQPVLQKLQKSGNWSSGRNIALSKLKNNEINCIKEEDIPVIAKLKQSSGYYSNEYYWDKNAIIALVGHPYIFLGKSPNVPLELEMEDVELIVEEKGNNCEFYFSSNISSDETLVKHSTNKYKVVNITEEIRNIKSIIGEKLTIPKEEKPKVLELLKSLSGQVKINSSLIGEHSEAEKITASSKIFIHLLPLGDGIKADVYVKPMDPEPPYLHPTEGLRKITGHNDDKYYWTERDFKQEKNSFNKLMEQCPIFASQAMDDYSATFETPLECLQVLSEFKAIGDDIVVEWPRGQKMAIKSKLSYDSFNISIKKQNNWFDLSGEVKIDEDKVISLVKMMKLLESAQNRFIEIEDGVFIELEKQFVKQLEYLKTVSDISSKQIKMHPLAAVTNAGLFDSFDNFVSDKEWNQFIKKIKKTEKANYDLPKGIDAELRQYQLEGYKWLNKMYDWGTGACLADDMGLGKTLQCIALLVNKMKEGPSMVVAPASVCRNWIAEIEKFAPALQPILFGMYDRKQTIETIEAGAVLIVSYGLLATEAELLNSRKWNIYILDEAHAIKNIATKRSQVAMSIEANFRIAATGTPIQNHLGELWNLFQFLNPGLLGSLQSFNQRFVFPIDRSNNEVARRALKDLIKPFILRRTKNQVLHDLPEKTEITVSIEMSDEERNFYEALRIKALEEIQKIDDSTNPGEKQMRVLAEITKLRMACCNSTLANKDIKIESSKLKRFEEITDILIENGHKALVFSQFIGHLSLMRNLLDSKGITYEYLDGSTSMKERESRIKNFQQGNADLFLISLKAGGVGLNLTAADYVIHMDPWWNPAIEDQASDRAHRIGQTKPVTIYRMVTKDTIEDKIVDLHKNKRDLADSLLEGTEGASKITADELINLLKF